MQNRPLGLALAILLLAALAAPVAAAEEDEEPPVNGWVRLQVQYDDGSLLSRQRGSDRPAVDGIARFPAVDTLSIRRFQSQLNFRLAPRLALETQGVYQQRNDEITLQRLALRYDLEPDHLQLVLGLQKVPFDYEQIRSNSTLNVLERSDVTRALAQNRDTGLALWGEEDWGEWAIGSYRGQRATDFSDSNSGNDVITRVVGDLSPSFRLGGYGHLGTIVQDGATLPVRRCGVEAHFLEGPWTVEGEALFSDGGNFFSDRDTLATGFYVDAVYEAAEWLDAVVHYDRFDPDLSSKNTRVPDNGSNNRDRYVFGLNFYLDRESRQRIVVDYEVHGELEGPVVNNNGWRVQYQVQQDF